MKSESTGHPARDDPPNPRNRAQELRDTACLVAVWRPSREEKNAFASVRANLNHLNPATGDSR